MRQVEEARRALRERADAFRRHRDVDSPNTIAMAPDEKKHKLNLDSLELDQTEAIILALVVKRVDVTELYSPARVTKVCHKHNPSPGNAYDLRDGIDLCSKDEQSKVVQRWEENEPGLAIAWPPVSWKCIGSLPQCSPRLFYLTRFSSTMPTPVWCLGC